MSQDLTTIARQFAPHGCSIESVRPFGTGSINKTFLAQPASPALPQFILQCINTRVFPHPQLIMKNMHLVCRHINNRAQRRQWKAPRRWLMPDILQTPDGSDHYIDAQGNFWRAMSFIESGEGHDSITSPQHAREVGRALGTFHSLVSDLPASQLADTLPGFHNTPLYLDNFQAVLATSQHPSSPEIRFCLHCIERQSEAAYSLENAKQAGRLKERPIHGDPKVSNILIDKDSDLALSIIDLDTVKPGLIHYDIGDCLRSACNSAGEEAPSFEDITFDLELCKEVLTGYLDQAKDFFTAGDFDFLYEAVHTIAFELGLRYFTDFLQGNIYFSVKTPEQNLHKAMIQFHLAKSIQSRAKAIKTMIAELRQHPTRRLS